jgi:membrane protease YdiL (CAAX protease family)
LIDNEDYQVGDASFSLTKLTYIFCSVSLFSNVVGEFCQFLLTRRGSTYIWAISNSYTLIVLAFLVAMCVSIAIYGPAKIFLPLQFTIRPENHKTSRMLIVGLLACIALCAAFLTQSTSNIGTRFVQQSASYPSSMSVILKIILVFLLVPLVSEVFFRGIVLRTLAEHLSAPAAILCSSLLFAHFWPFFNWYWAISLGVITSILYYCQRSLIFPIIVNIAATTLGGMYLVFPGFGKFVGRAI